MIGLVEEAVRSTASREKNYPTLFFLIPRAESLSFTGHEPTSISP
jgi:hypothetical protein